MNRKREDKKIASDLPLPISRSLFINAKPGTPPGDGRIKT